MSTTTLADPEQVDWPTFLADCDLRWNQGVGDAWGDSAFIADGVTGASIYGLAEAQTPGALRWQLGRTDVTAHHQLKEPCVPRVPIGNVVLRPRGPVTGTAMRLRLWDAEATGEIRSDSGRVVWRSFIEREAGVLVIEAFTEDGSPAPELDFVEEWSITPVLGCRGIDPATLPPADLPPRPLRETDEPISVVVQPLTRHGAHATAWVIEQPSPQRQVMYLAVRPSYHPEAPRDHDVAVARDAAVAAVRQAQQAGLALLEQRHRAWWHDYLRQAWVSLPNDPAWQRFYWVQIYKFGCASRADVPIITDNLGPWYHPCGWAGTWWNLNVQLSYFPAFSGNRMDVGRSMVTALDHYFASGSLTVPGHPEAITIDRATSYDAVGGKTLELGNLTWTLHNYWRYWKYSMDEAVGRQLARLLKADVNYYLLVMTERDGRFHLPAMASPEYPGGLFEDTNYSLQLLRWALQTLLDFDERFALHDSDAGRWRDVLERLCDLPTNEHGLMVAPKQSYDLGHRHYSHLLALYPLHTINPDQGPDAAALFRRSFDRWRSMREGWYAFSDTGTAAMHATLGEGDPALAELDHLWNDPLILPNTMFATARCYPVIETPLSVVESINYMLLQSWDDVIRVFPAVPARWADVTFHHLRAEGAFLVSAERRDGQTRWIDIHSLAGAPCLLQTDMMDPQAEGSRRFQIERQPGPRNTTRLRIDLQQGETLRLRCGRGV